MSKVLAAGDTPEIQPLNFNKPQLRFVVSLLRHAVSIWARASGKSSIIAWLIHLIVTWLPRSSWAIVGRTYQQMLTRTLPSTVAALERLGYVRDVHYVMGRKPPRHWPLPLEAPLRFDYYITFYNGTGFHLISQDGGGGNSRGLNLDGIICDESLLLDKAKFDADTQPANRGNERYKRFNRVPFHHGVFHFTSMPLADEAQWLLDQGDYYKELGVDYITICNELADLQEQFIDCRDADERKQLWPQIKELMQQRTFSVDQKTGVLYSEANAFDNIENLRLRYLEDQRKTLPDFTFGIEMLNRRPTRAGAGFYPNLRITHHTYRASADAKLEGLNYDFAALSKVTSAFDADCDPHLPLRLAVDWGARISVLSIAQRHLREYRFLNSFYVMHPKLIRELAKMVIDYYSGHLQRSIEFLEDAEWGNARKPDSTETYNDQFCNLLTAAGWRVKRINLGRAPSHPARYQIAKELLGETDPTLPIIRFNREKCHDQLTALSLAPVRIDKGVIEKDKTSERRKSTKQQHATHFTDATDLHLVSIGSSVIQRRPDFRDLLIVSN